MKNLKNERPDRAGKRVIASFVEKDVYREFKVLAAEQLTTTDALVSKAIELLLENYGKPVPPSLKVKLREIGL